MNKQNLFDHSSIDEQTFLAEYWHQKPLLIKQALSKEALKVLPNKEDLIQYSCKEDIQSRIVCKHSETDYQVEYGPFIENDFDSLDQDCWNLLVSDIDKWLPQSTGILQYFKFIRNWIFDDIMLSCGSIQGTVGPHTDHYDVFLIQVHGQRQWQFCHDKIYDPELMPQGALKLLADFKADETHVLNPGDVLYLPPEICHYGIASSDDCVTCSIGMRTPSHSELLTAFVDNLAQGISENMRFNEPQFARNPKQGEITAQDLLNIENILLENLKVNKQTLGSWFGKYITEYRSLFYEFNQYQETEQLDISKDLSLSTFSRSCYFANDKNTAKLYVNGHEYQTSMHLADLICNHKKLLAKNLKQLDQNDLKTVKKLFENGSIIT